MPPRSLSLLILLLVLTALAAPSAHAQHRGAKDLTRRAKKHVADGLAAQDAGDFTTAIAEYERAYRLVPHPEILFNLGQAHRLDGQPARALSYYRRYLAIEPDGRVAADAKRWIAELEPIVGDTPEPDDTLPGERPTERTSPLPDPGKPYLYAGISCIGVGLVSVGWATLFGLEARNIDRTLSNHQGPWTDALLAEQDRGRSMETRSILLASAGGVLVVGGAALIYVGHRKFLASRQQPTFAVAPMFGGGTTGLVISGVLP